MVSQTEWTMDCSRVSYNASYLHPCMLMCGPLRMEQYHTKPTDIPNNVLGCFLFYKFPKRYWCPESREIILNLQGSESVLRISITAACNPDKLAVHCHTPPVPYFCTTRMFVWTGSGRGRRIMGENTILQMMHVMLWSFHHHAPALLTTCSHMPLVGSGLKLGRVISEL